MMVDRARGRTTARSLGSRRRRAAWPRRPRSSDLAGRSRCRSPTPTGSCCSTARCSRGSPRSTGSTPAARARCCARRSRASVVAGGEGRRWLLDPVLIDSALQVQVIWARLQWDVTLLPAEIGAYALFDAPAPGEPVRLELRIRPESTSRRCATPTTGSSAADGRLLATLTDVVGVGSRR